MRFKILLVFLIFFKTKTKVRFIAYREVCDFYIVHVVNLKTYFCTFQIITFHNLTYER